MDTEVYQDLDSDRYLSAIGKVYGNAAGDLEMTTVSRPSMNLITRKEAVRKLEKEPGAKIW